jgi:hypothetical protein
MAELILPKPKIGKTDKETIQNLFDCIELMRKEFLNFARYIDSDNVTEINTNQTTVKSDKGTTQIKGPLLLMYDKQTIPILRLQMGYDPVLNKFVFQMYDAAGNLTLSENDAGEAVFAGNISTDKDAYVGKNLHLGPGGSSETRVIYFNDFMSILAKYEGGYVIQLNCGILDFIGNIHGEWEFSTAEFIDGLESHGYATQAYAQNYADSLMAQHISAYHSGT